MEKEEIIKIVEDYVKENPLKDSYKLIVDIRKRFREIIDCGEEADLYKSYKTALKIKKYIDYLDKIGQYFPRDSQFCHTNIQIIEKDNIWHIKELGRNRMGKLYYVGDEFGQEERLEMDLSDNPFILEEVYNYLTNNLYTKSKI